MRYPDNKPEEKGWYRVNIADRKTGMDRRRVKAFWIGSVFLFSGADYSENTHEITAYDPVKITGTKKHDVPTLENGKSVEKYCPDCKPLVKLIVRTNRYNGGQFLGCPNYPKCKFTSEIPEDIIMRAQGQKGMFDGTD